MCANTNGVVGTTLTQGCVEVNTVPTVFYMYTHLGMIMHVHVGCNWFNHIYKCCLSI